MILLFAAATPIWAEEAWDVNQPPPGSESCATLLDPSGAVYLESLRQLEEYLGFLPSSSSESARSSKPHVKLYWPSLTLPMTVIGEVTALQAYELRGFCTDVMDMVKTPGQKLVIVTSQSLEPATVKNCLARVLIQPDLVEEAYQRITLFSAESESNLPLSQKLAPSKERFTLLKDIIDQLSENGRWPVYMNSFNSTPLEGWVARELGAALFGNPFVNGNVEPKSLYHKVAETAGVRKAEAITHIGNRRTLLEAIHLMIQRGHDLLKIKMNNGASGLGNADFFLGRDDLEKIRSNTKEVSVNIIDELLNQVLVPGYEELTSEEFLRRFFDDQGVVEQYIPNIVNRDDNNHWSPSGQFDVYSNSIQARGCHDQKFIDGKVGVFEGAIYPAAPDICIQIYAMGMQIAKELQKRGYRGRFSMDTVVAKNSETEFLEVWLVEINARRGGTHTLDSMISLTDAQQVQPGEEEFLGLPTYQWYVLNNSGVVMPLASEGTDNFYNEKLKSFCSDQELLDFIYHTDFSTFASEVSIPMADVFNKRGILPHMIQARTQGKMGFLAIEQGGVDQAHQLYSNFERAFTEALEQKPFKSCE